MTPANNPGITAWHKRQNENYFDGELLSPSDALSLYNNLVPPDRRLQYLWALWYHVKQGNLEAEKFPNDERTLLMYRRSEIERFAKEYAPQVGQPPRWDPQQVYEAGLFGRMADKELADQYDLVVNTIRVKRREYGVPSQLWYKRMSKKISVLISAEQGEIYEWLLTNRITNEDATPAELGRQYLDEAKD